MTRVLVVEDDLLLGRTLVRALREAGYEVEVAPSGEAGLIALAERPAQVTILDVVLPGIDGFETCRRLRDAGSRTAVLVLSARGRVADRVAGLDAGADDYVVKPFALEEVAARLHALLRRRPDPPAERLEVGSSRTQSAGPTPKCVQSPT